MYKNIFGFTSTPELFSFLITFRHSIYCTHRVTLAAREEKLHYGTAAKVSRVYSHFSSLLTLPVYLGP